MSHSCMVFGNMSAGYVSMIRNDERMSDFSSEDASYIVLDYDGMRHIIQH